MALKKQRIGEMTGRFLIAFAAICETLQAGLKILWLIPGLGILDIALSKAISLFAVLTIGFTLFMNGVYPITSRRGGQDMAWLGTMTIIEMIPGADWLPSLTLWTIYKVRHSQKEDRAILKKQEEEQQKAIEEMQKAQMAQIKSQNL